jgi:hypothetical protein
MFRPAPSDLVYGITITAVPCVSGRNGKTQTRRTYVPASAAAATLPKNQVGVQRSRRPSKPVRAH